jgi:hypothetical protein
MSWEEMGSETRPCPCGKGTVTYRWEMDDWNRTRNDRTINCAKCQADAEAEERAAIEREQERAALLSKAGALASGRYLETWLSLFVGKSKKKAWLIYTGGRGYPALGTFYKHVRDFDGVEKYLRWSFEHDIDKVLRTLGVDDSEVTGMLRDAEKMRVPLEY